MISSQSFDRTMAIIGHGTGFIAKQYVLIRGINAIRSYITEKVTEVAKHHFDSVRSAIIGTRMGKILALPVTALLGDLVWSCIVEALYVTISQIACVVGLIKKQTTTISRATELGIRVATSLCSFCIRSLTMEFSGPAVYWAINHLSSLFSLLSHFSFWNFYLQPFFMIGSAVSMTTPGVLVLADILGLISYALITRALNHHYIQHQIAQKT